MADSAGRCQGPAAPWPRRGRPGEPPGSGRPTGPTGSTLGGMGQTPDEMLSAVSASLAVRTGRSLDEWVALVQAHDIDPIDQNAVRRWLRSEHGVAQNSQWAIADAAARAAGWVRPSVEEYIDGQYGGAKAGLRPIYDALASVIGGLGEDVHAEGRGGEQPVLRAA